jgi:hypothetical protein
MEQASAPDTGTSVTPDTGQPDSPDTGNAASATEADTTDWKAEATKWQGLSRKHEDQAKQNSAAAKELARVRRDAMSDQERAVSEAAEKARSEAVTEVVARLGGRLVISEIRAAVAGRLPNDQLDALVEHLDLSGFLNDNGEVDATAVAAFAQRIAPEVTGSPTFPELGQGPRAPAVNGAASDPLLSALKGKLGIST